VSKDATSQDQAKAQTEVRDEPGTYVHETAGIRERSGIIPTWLTAVSVGLIIWGVYYMIRYWSSD
jgi:hypothetical protein